MAQFLFGSGILWGTPLVDLHGVSLTTPTPVQFGVLQEVSVDISFDAKMLYGQSQQVVDAGRNKGHIIGKAKFAKLNGWNLNSLFFNEAAPTFRCDLFAPYGSKQLVLTISKCSCAKLMRVTEQGDFVVPEFDFQGLADGSNNVLTWALSE